MPDIRQASTSFLQSSLAQLATGSGGVDAVSAATSGLQSEGRAASAAAAIEDAVYQQHGGDTGNAYREQMRSLALQLGKHNPDLGLRVLQGQAAPVQVASMDAEDIKSDDRADADEAMREQGLRDAVGTSKIPVYVTDEPGQTSAVAAEELPLDGEKSAQGASMGEEGDFKLRAQPKIHGLEGIEFESGM